MPPSEPTPQDIAAVAAHIDNQPAAPATAPTPGQVVQPQSPAQPAPAQQPQAPTPQPAPSSQPAGDPFEALFTPTEPAQPQPAPQAPPTQPTEPVTPPPTQPTEPTQQQPQTPTEPQPTTPEPPAQPTYQSYDDYMKTVLGDMEKPPELPDHSKISPDDEAGIKKFFDDLVDTAVQRAEQIGNRKAAIQAAERTLWDEAFDKYGSLKTNKDLRDMVHSIRMGYFQRGVAITPTQAADKLLDSMKKQYNQGVADNQVHTTIESTQPVGGGSGQPIATTADKQETLQALQTGGETALAAMLDAEIKAGRL